MSTTEERDSRLDLITHIPRDCELQVPSHVHGLDRAEAGQVVTTLGAFKVIRSAQLGGDRYMHFTYNLGHLKGAARDVAVDQLKSDIFQVIDHKRAVPGAGKTRKTSRSPVNA